MVLQSACTKTRLIDDYGVMRTVQCVYLLYILGAQKSRFSALKITLTR